jgi:hypothetical protein
MQTLLRYIVGGHIAAALVLGIFAAVVWVSDPSVRSAIVGPTRNDCGGEFAREFFVETVADSYNEQAWTSHLQPADVRMQYVTARDVDRSARRVVCQAQIEVSNARGSGVVTFDVVYELAASSDDRSIVIQTQNLQIPFLRLGSIARAGTLDRKDTKK